MTGVVRNTAWSQLQMFTRAPSASTVDAHPPTSDRASTSNVGMPAFARYAAQMRPLCPAPTTIAP